MEGSSVQTDAKPEGEASTSPTPAAVPSPDGVLGSDVESTSESTGAGRLDAITAAVRDQGDIERDIGRRAEQLLTNQENERDEKRLEKASREKAKLESQVRKLEERLRDTAAGPATSRRAVTELSNYQAQIDNLNRDISDIQERINERVDTLLAGAGLQQPSGTQRQSGETEREFLIRTGKITPFSRFSAQQRARPELTLEDALLNAEAEPDAVDAPQALVVTPTTKDVRSHRVLLRPGFHAKTRTPESSSSRADEKPVIKKRRTDREGSSTATPRGSSAAVEDDVFTPAAGSPQDAADYSGGDSGDDAFLHKDTGAKKKTKAAKAIGKDEEGDDLDDGNEVLFQARLGKWVTRRKEAREAVKSTSAQTEDDAEAEDEDDGNEVWHDAEEWHLPHPTVPDFELDGGFRLPGDVHPSLFDYQKTGVQWLWELYSQSVGGIVGDEMGLGKTIQVIAFLAGLHHSKKLNKPVIVVAPATVMKQWVNEFHTWWPALRVSILHSSGSGMVDIKGEAKREDRLVNQTSTKTKSRANPRSIRAAKKIVDRVVEHGHVLVTTYSGLQTYAELLIPVDWEYAVLDEGHKIRNPNAGLTLFCKELRTPNRIILSGTPMQNNLIELWSLFDFVFPMRLGNLMDFKHQFEFPIRMGGYANASNLAIQTANKCAEALKDAIAPYLLQRLKSDVAADLPKKTERVLFAKLNKTQREAYESFLGGDDVKRIFNGTQNALFGIDILRKICNHPDLADHKILSKKAGYDYGKPSRSAKMLAVRELLTIFKEGGHKTLLFTQSVIMLDILEAFVKMLPGITYQRMDGSTPIATRQTLVDRFNNDPSIHVFLLSTKVGGLGVNLTGADRVILYDPDWNPSTDAQAQERAWRLGQTRSVEIYRLLLAGTIEEKIYHRQLYKQFLTNKVMKDPRLRQTFQLQDLQDLFSLGDAKDKSTETSRLFAGSELKPDSTDEPTGEETAQIRALRGVAALEPLRDSPLGDHSGNTVDSKRSPTPGTTPAASPPKGDRITAGILAKMGVHTALEHDKIVNGRRQPAADAAMTEREASRIAAESARALQRAETVARSTPAGVPTWTGQFGTAGAPASAGAANAGPSSSSILAGLATGRGGDASARASIPRRGSSSSVKSNGTGGASKPAGAGAERRRARREQAGLDLTKLVRDFLLAHGGQAPTAMLTNHFQRRCASAELVSQCKATLRELAFVRRGTGFSSGRGVWVLKEKYRNAQ